MNGSTETEKVIDVENKLKVARVTVMMGRRDKLGD